jgi:hypothetical protein
MAEERTTSSKYLYTKITIVPGSEQAYNNLHSARGVFELP